MKWRHKIRWWLRDWRRYRLAMRSADQAERLRAKVGYRCRLPYEILMEGPTTGNHWAESFAILRSTGGTFNGVVKE